MKRSQVNEILKEGDAFIRSFGYVMPPFAYLSPEELKASDHKMIKERGMGWDITDYGQESMMKWGCFCSRSVMAWFKTSKMAPACSMLRRS